jgi:hypothetical protein
VLNQLNPYFPLLACLGTWLIVAAGILYTRCSIADLSSHVTEVMAEANVGRLEEKIDKIENRLSACLRRLESQ